MKSASFDVAASADFSAGNAQPIPGAAATNHHNVGTSRIGGRGNDAWASADSAAPRHHSQRKAQNVATVAQIPTIGCSVVAKPSQTLAVLTRRSMSADQPAKTKPYANAFD